MPRKLMLSICVLFSTAASTDSTPVGTALQAVADDVAKRFKCSIALSFHTANGTTSRAAGYTDAGLDMGTPTRAAQPDDVYVWGSTTKMFTATAVLQLVDAGTVKLDDPITLYIDPYLKRVNGTVLADHFGSEIAKVRVEELLHMTSGLGDYDRSAYTLAQFAERTHDFTPLEILSNYVPPLSRWPGPGHSQRYCSTNYILLGLLLAQHAGSDDWSSYKQISVVPKSLQLVNTAFADSGSCASYTPVHGFMQSYEGLPIPAQDVRNLSCVGGWTAGNLVAPVGDIAKFTREVYRPGGTVVSAAMQQRMANFSAPGSRGFKFYGMGTFNLGWSIGDDLSALGHVGDTYGYQSQATYFPHLDAALAVATNIERPDQAQPADATCHAYHAIVAALKGEPAPTCTFTVPHRFIGECKCSKGDARGT